ncbi:copper uptake system-associated protein [Bradyrhizobium sp. LA6.7]|uniref:copper uptake system-associated protein n=2 Tax=unclassified Bradyrhizobium TaxID=2631580 RepID=UPI00339803F7
MVRTIMFVPVRRCSELIKTSVGALSLMLILLTGDVARAADAEVDIARLLHGMFDKPGAALEVAPVVIAGDFAIAGWTQGDMGGRALLRHKQAAWVITLCAGDGIKSREALRQAGVPEQEATSLAHDLAAAESKLDAQRVAMFSRFEGLVTMDGTPYQANGAPHRTK